MRISNFKRLQPDAQKALKLTAKSTGQEIITESATVTPAKKKRSRTAKKKATATAATEVKKETAATDHKNHSTHSHGKGL